MRKSIYIVIAAVIFLSSINTATAIECSNKVEILRLNMDRPKKDSIICPRTYDSPRYAIDPNENIWISYGNSIKLYSTNDGVNYEGKFIVRRGGWFAVSSDLLFVINPGPYYFPKYQMYDISGVVDIVSGIDVYERQENNDLYKIIKSIHEKDSIVSNVYGYVPYINRDNQLFIGMHGRSNNYVVYLNKDLELIDRKKRLYLTKGEVDIFFRQKNLLYTDDIPENERHGLLILDADEKVLSEFRSRNEYGYIRNIYGEIVFIENKDELLQFDINGKIKNKIDISCINKNIYEMLFPQKLIGPNGKLYFPEKENGDLVIYYIDLKNK